MPRRLPPSLDAGRIAASASVPWKALSWDAVVTCEETQARVGEDRPAPRPSHGRLPAGGLFQLPAVWVLDLPAFLAS